MLDNVVKHDGIERFIGRERIGKITRSYRQTARGGAAANHRIGLDAQDLEMRARSFEKPSVGATHIEQTPSPWLHMLEYDA